MAHEIEPTASFGCLYCLEWLHKLALKIPPGEEHKFCSSIETSQSKPYLRNLHRTAQQVPIPYSLAPTCYLLCFCLSYIISL